MIILLIILFIASCVINLFLYHLYDDARIMRDVYKAQLTVTRQWLHAAQERSNRFEEALQ